MARGMFPWLMNVVASSGWVEYYLPSEIVRSVAQITQIGEKSAKSASQRPLWGSVEHFGVSSSKV